MVGPSPRSSDVITWKDELSLRLGRIGNPNRSSGQRKNGPRKDESCLRKDQ